MALSSTPITPMGRPTCEMFRALDIPWGLQELERHYSPDWHNVYRAAGIPPERWAEADRMWRASYRDQRPVLQHGANQVVHSLARKYRLGLVTSGSGVRVRTQLCAFGLVGLFEVLIFGDRVPRRKPHPVALRLAVQSMGVEPAACVYVGDAPEDVAMARRAGMVAVGCDRTFPRAATAARFATGCADRQNHRSARSACAVMELNWWMAGPPSGRWTETAFCR